jgi:hypothetical protein
MNKYSLSLIGVETSALNSAGKLAGWRSIAFYEATLFLFNTKDVRRSPFFQRLFTFSQFLPQP